MTKSEWGDLIRKAEAQVDAAETSAYNSTVKVITQRFADGVHRLMLENDLRVAKGQRHVDKGVLDIVVRLWALGIQTTGSCEGHLQTELVKRPESRLMTSTYVITHVPSAVEGENQLLRILRWYYTNASIPGGVDFCVWVAGVGNVPEPAEWSRPTSNRITIGWQYRENIYPQTPLEVKKAAAIRGFVSALDAYGLHRRYEPLKDASASVVAALLEHDAILDRLTALQQPSVQR